MLDRGRFVAEDREATTLRGGLSGELPKVGLEFNDVWGSMGSPGEYTVSLAIFGNH